MKVSLRHLVRIALIIGMTLSAYVARANNMAEPPFWLSSYDEFKDLLPEQKEFYLEQLQKEIVHLPALKDTTRKDLRQAAEWYEDWNRLRKKVYTSCDQSELKDVCERVADIRLQTLSLLHTHDQPTPASESQQ